MVVLLIFFLPEAVWDVGKSGVDTRFEKILVFVNQGFFYT
jgi:hypothetical protein